ncbi:heavy metal translocating P-type ATPase [Mangrovicoccus sp. HB161399]|uniref:heavy metal translocating P-type ATPase n=1 Tax=Mangrovicoccus sp. HB161399 TaxID=2720392 RepID=UPI0015569DB6|nr:heavy metal translocating P-type ATPase [Mangrovicoccus sp. HB161399]
MADGTRSIEEWRVTGMDCGSCAAKVRGAVERLPGVSAVEVTLMAERLRLELDGGQCSRAEVETAVRAVGFGISAQDGPAERVAGRFVLPDAGIAPAAAPAAAAADPAPASRLPGWLASRKGRAVAAAAAALALAWIAELAAGGRIGDWAFALAALVGLVPVARRAAAMARAGMPFTIEMLMTIAALGALAIGAQGEAAVVVFLFALGELLEGMAAGKARDGIRALAALKPATARLAVGPRIREVAADSLAPGHVVQLRPGDRAPADGIVTAGRSGVDQSAVTGESVPVAKGPGDEVLAGSVNADAELRLRVTRAAGESAIDRIVRLVEEAETARAPVQRFIDRFSRWYMPAVVGAAAAAALLPPLLAGADWQTWIYRGLALLLIGCPCALVISVPASIASALSAGARHGLLMKGGAVVEAAARTTLVAFDKTGTLTAGRPQVTDLQPADATAEDLLRLAAAVESGASHPLGKAILAAAEAAGHVLPEAAGAGAIPGRGAFATVEGRVWTVGSPHLAAEAGLLQGAAAERAAGFEAEGKTVAAVFAPDCLAGLIALRDEPRADAAEAVAALKAMGVGAVMLTGDNARTGTAVAGRIGLDCRAGLLPEDKVAAVRDMAARERVLMLGDGINDAPALAAAHVGLAMGSGTDVALETADGALLRDRVGDVAAILRLSRAAMANIRQNVGIALGLKAVFLATTLAGITGLWIAILADTGATVLVTANALRLLRFRPDRGD